MSGSEKLGRRGTALRVPVGSACNPRHREPEPGMTSKHLHPQESFSSESYPDPWADPKSRSTLGFL